MNPVVTTFPTLYKRKGKNKVSEWTIHVEVNLENQEYFDIVVNYGEQGGKIQQSRDTIKSGKNLGKANETSVQQQAEAEAEAKFVKQQDRQGYVQNINDIDKDLRPGVEPMLAHRYDKSGDKMEYPCFIQPKLDGHRCIAVLENGGCKLFSRKREEIMGLPHINKFLESFFSSRLSNGMRIVLDGELYNHEYKDKFEELTGFIRSKTPKEGHEVVQYHVYDLVEDSVFDKRATMLQLLEEQLTGEEPLKIVDTQQVEEDEVIDVFNQFLSIGYEGAILRHASLNYEHKRSYGLLKVKQFEDEEFKIVAIDEGRGKMAGHAIFECQVGPDRFKVKMKGSEDRLKEIFQNQSEYVGKLLTVQFQGKTTNGIPRFPVGLRLRDE